MQSSPQKYSFPPSHLVKDEVILFPSCLRNNVCCCWKTLTEEKQNLMWRDDFHVMAFSFSKAPVVKSYK